MKKGTKNIQLSVLLILTLLSSCVIENNKPFDSNEWNKKGVDWQITKFREKMVADLIESDTLIGLKRSQIFKLIGEPEIDNEHNLKYLVREKYGWNIDPEYIKYLWIELNENGIATKIYIEKTR